MFFRTTFFVLISTLLLYLGSAKNMHGQNADIFDMLDSNLNNGNVEIIQDSSVYNLMYRDREINKKNNCIPNGYRIQIFSASGNDAREKVMAFKEVFLERHPEFAEDDVYQLYQPPFFKLRVGDYRNMHEALIVYKELVKYYPNCYIMPSPVNFPKLHTQ